MRDRLESMIQRIAARKVAADHSFTSLEEVSEFLEKTEELTDSLREAVGPFPLLLKKGKKLPPEMVQQLNGTLESLKGLLAQVSGNLNILREARDRMEQGRTRARSAMHANRPYKELPELYKATAEGLGGIKMPEAEGARKALEEFSVKFDDYLKSFS